MQFKIQSKRYLTKNANFLVLLDLTSAKRNSLKNKL